MRNFLAFFIFTLFSTCCLAQADKEPEVVITEEYGLVQFNSVNNIIFTRFQSKTIHSAKGNDHGYLVFFENQFRKMKKFDVIIRDSLNKEIMSYSVRDFEPEMHSNSINTYSEDLLYILDCRQFSFPYTVEFKSTMKFDFLFDLTWMFTNGMNTKTLSSRFSVECPLDFPLAFSVNRADLVNVDSLVVDETKRYNFGVDSNYSFTYQPYERENEDPLVTLIAEEFEFGKIGGSFKSWTDFGTWLNMLWEGRSELPKAAKEDIDEVIAGKATSDEKARAIYKYVQSRMRYVFVGYGLGGLQTMYARDTYKYGYGDCKGLTNFTNAAMNYAGIASYPALIASGKDHVYIDPNRPINNFNHVVLCLPSIGDTTWLECTSRKGPFGYTSNFTDDRYALIIKPEGGVLVRTPAFSEQENIAIRDYRIGLESGGSAKIHFEGEYHNLAMERSAFKWNESSKSPPNNSINEELRLSSFDLIQYDSKLYPNDEAMLEVSFDVKARNVGRRVGNRMMVFPFINNNILPVLDSTDTRTIPVYFKHGYTISDSILVVLPEGMKLSETPSDFELKTKYGTMKIDLNYNQVTGEVFVTRTVLFKKGEYPALEYEDICKFLHAIKNYNNTYLVYERK